MAISENWANLLEPGLRSIFYLTFGALAGESLIPVLFNTDIKSTKAQEHFLGVGGMADWKEYKGRIEYDDITEGYKTTLTHKEYVEGFKVERKLVDDDQYNIINAKPRQMGMAAQRTREKHAASVFNNAFSASYTGGDSVALCSDSHPYSPDNATTQDNSGTLALSYDNIVTTRRLMQEFKDDRGEIVPINPDLVLFPPELAEAANAALATMNAGSPQRPDSADYHARLVGEGAKIAIKPVMWHYLTDANAWFLMDSQLAKVHLLWLDRVPLEFALDPTSDFNLEAKFRGYMRYSYGWSAWAWVYGNNPS